ncbi:Arm DNA-binding domain-containing protein [Klebsiella pneumoniae]|uniref:Arm DNA-binding domain-containing protein n=1 Tax=Klebsiella pneumoniae TaxID=573 RepID=UPI00396F3654
MDRLKGDCKLGKTKQGSLSLPRGVTIRQHKTGATLVITFTYKGVLCREPLSRMEANPRGIKYAERLLGRYRTRSTAASSIIQNISPTPKSWSCSGW